MTVMVAEVYGKEEPHMSDGKSTIKVEFGFGEVHSVMVLHERVAEMERALLALTERPGALLVLLG